MTRSSAYDDDLYSTISCCQVIVRSLELGSIGSISPTLPRLGREVKGFSGLAPNLSACIAVRLGPMTEWFLPDESPDIRHFRGRY